MTETQATSGTAGTSMDRAERDEAAEGSAADRAAVGRATVPAEKGKSADAPDPKDNGRGDRPPVTASARVGGGASGRAANAAICSATSPGRLPAATASASSSSGPRGCWRSHKAIASHSSGPTTSTFPSVTSGMPGAYPFACLIRQGPFCARRLPGAMLIYSPLSSVQCGRSNSATLLPH